MPYINTFEREPIHSGKLNQRSKGKTTMNVFLKKAPRFAGHIFIGQQNLLRGYDVCVGFSFLCVCGGGDNVVWGF